ETGMAPADSFTAPARSIWRQIEPAVLGGCSILVLLLLWELLPQLVTLGAGTKMLFTTPSKVAVTLWNLIITGKLWTPLSVSAAAFAMGLVLSIAVGLPLGVVLGRSRT